MSHPNPLGNAVRVGDVKTDFLEALADWLKNGWLKKFQHHFIR